MAQTEIFLPFPPSVNGLYNGGLRSKRRFKSARYRKWIANAKEVLESQMAIPSAPIHPGKVNAIYAFKRPDNRRRDLSNSLKALEDFLTDHKIIADDSNIHGMVAFWIENVSYADFICARPYLRGVQVTIKDAWAA